MNMKDKKEQRRIWILRRIQAFRHWLFCVAGIGLAVMLPGLRHGIVGISLYLPSPLEIGVGLGVGFLAVVLDEELGGEVLIKNKAADRRKRKHAFIVGLGILGVLERLFGGA